MKIEKFLRKNIRTILWSKLSILSKSSTSVFHVSGSFQTSLKLFSIFSILSDFKLILTALTMMLVCVGTKVSSFKSVSTCLVEVNPLINSKTGSAQNIRKASNWKLFPLFILLSAQQAMSSRNPEKSSEKSTWLPWTKLNFDWSCSFQVIRTW